MARDRLAAIRAQRQADRGPAPPAADDAREQIEMAPQEPQSPFYAEILTMQDGVRTLNENVSRIADLHARALGELDAAAAARTAAQLEALVDETRALAEQLKARIMQVHQDARTGRDARAEKQQTEMLRQRFVAAIQNYQQVEKQYRAKFRQRMERQFRVVKPDATPEEVMAVMNDGEAGQIFTQALQASTRYGESRAAYREVQTRHEDVRRIEKTMVELAQLFSDISLLVEQQEETIDVVQTTAMSVERDAEAGLSHTQKAVASARSARKKRWICFIIILIILAVVAIVVGVTVPKN